MKWYKSAKRRGPWRGPTSTGVWIVYVVMCKLLLGLVDRQFLRATAYAIAILSVRLSVTRVDQSKTVEVKIVQFSPYSSPSVQASQHHL